MIALYAVSPAHELARLLGRCVRFTSPYLAHHGFRLEQPEGHLHVAVELNGEAGDGKTVEVVDRLVYVNVFLTRSDP